MEQIPERMQDTMEQLPEMNKKAMSYTWPIIGAAVPITFMLVRRLIGRSKMQSRDQMLLGESRIDLQTAMETALRYMPGTPVEVELEEEHGMPVWEVEIVPKDGGPTREILIDARSGEILEMKAEYMDEEEKAA